MMPDAASAMPDAAPPPPFSGDCTAQFTLHGLDPQTPRIALDALAIDTTGTSFCLILDATSNIREGHFGAETSRIDGTTSPFELTLFDAQNNLLGEGWDVSFGASPMTQTFENLEFSVTAGTVLEAKLRVRMREGCVIAGAGTTSLGMVLLEPFE